MSNYKTVFFTLGLLQIILGLSMIIPVLIQLVYSESDSGFIVSGLATIIFGMLFYLSNLDHDKKINLQQAFLLTSLSWLSIAIFGSLPFIFSEINLSLTDAFFESMSGITTTGSTIMSEILSFDRPILLWRALMQWVGGLGILSLGLILLPFLRIGGMQLFKMEGPDNTEKILPRTIEVATIIISTYIILTVVCGFFYWIFGMTVFDSISHAMTTIATGGFSTHNESIGFIPIDSIFTPIKNVKYHVEDFRVEQKTDYEKLVFDIITDGSISPQDALTDAARILIHHFMLFSDERITLEADEIAKTETYDEESLHMRQLLKTKLTDMDLSVRALNCLKAAEVETLGDLVSFNKNDLMKFRNFGKKSLTELEELVLLKGLSFGMDLSKYKLERE